MRLDFNVLWVEDNQQNVLAQKLAMERRIRSEGFRLKVQFANTVDEATGFLSDDIYVDHVDLVLMDFDLGAGKHGDEGLSEVRNIVQYKDIVFYSGTSTAALREKVKKQNVDGVYVANRDALTDSVVALFENLVRKVLDIDHSRGIVMGATSDVDKTVFDGLVQLFDGCDNSQKQTVIDDIKGRADKKSEQLATTLAAIKNVNHVSELADHHALYTSDDRLRLLLKVMKHRSFQQDKTTHFEKYRKDVMPRRNDLAHIRVEPTGFARKFFDRNGKELSAEDMRTLRVEILEFQDVLSDIFHK